MQFGVTLLIKLPFIVGTDLTIWNHIAYALHTDYTFLLIDRVQITVTTKQTNESEASSYGIERRNCMGRAKMKLFYPHLD